MLKLNIFYKILVSYIEILIFQVLNECSSISPVLATCSQTKQVVKLSFRTLKFMHRENKGVMS